MPNKRYSVASWHDRQESHQSSLFDSRLNQQVLINSFWKLYGIHAILKYSHLPNCSQPVSTTPIVLD